MKTSRVVMGAALLSVAVGLAGLGGGDSARVILHEWGTFTSVVDGNGSPLRWRPLGGPDDLPRFVYGLAAGATPPLRRWSLKAELPALVRMETPVVYFYADHPLTASVHVSFPMGFLTEWYPRARAEGGSLAWDHVAIQPGAEPALPSEAEPSRYYEARKTDAAPLQVPGPAGGEHERFLFYRGVGNLEPVLTASLAGSQVVLRARERSIRWCLLFENREGRVGSVLVPLAHGAAQAPRPDLDGSPADAVVALQDELVAAGLYPREAEAMLETWRDSWFEEGLRILYLVPRKTTDAVLPLVVSPPPSEVVRVLVARVEMVTPEAEASFLREIADLDDTPEAIAAAAGSLLALRGRFAEPILRSLQRHTPDQALQQRIDRVTDAAGRGPASSPSPSPRPPRRR